MPITGESDYVLPVLMTSETERPKRIEGVHRMEAVDRIEETNAHTASTANTENGEMTKSREGASKRSWKESLIHEVRTHPFGYVVLTLFVLAGPLLAPLLFPQAPPAVAVVGGLAFGLYAALCAVPQKFL
jgi:hypothetical protein